MSLKQKKVKLNEKCRKIKIVLTDVDGVLTDGGMYYSEKGEVMKKFNTKDGMAVELLLKKNIKTIFMTKEKSVIAKIRGKKVNAVEIYLNVKKKENQLNKIMKKYKVESDEIAYIGDDVNDIDIMTQVGISFTPLDGNDKVKNIADKICTCKGGDGVFREVTDFLLSFHKN